MSTSIDIHSAERITARAGSTRSAPLTITVIDRDNRQHTEVILYTGDFGLTRRLADAINAAVREHEVTAAAHREHVEARGTDAVEIIRETVRQREEV